MSYLNREQAPFPGGLWERIDAAALEAARDQLTARRYLGIDGPFGLGLTTLEVNDDQVLEGREGVEIDVNRAIAVPLLKISCRLSARRIGAHLDRGTPLDLAPVEEAAEKIARAEESLIYSGESRRGIEGLSSGKQPRHHKCKDWNKMNDVLADVLAAVTQLDESGLRGSYALALPSQYYNQLFRRYEDSDMLQLDHLKTLCRAGVYKAECEQPLVIDVHVGNLILGQDMKVGYAGTDGTHYELFVSESIVLRRDDPTAVCVLDVT